MSKKNAAVTFNGVRQHSFSAQKDCLVTLNAGLNVVSIEKLERLTGKTGNKELDAMKSDSFIEMLELGEIKILDDEAVVTAESGKTNAQTGISEGGEVIAIDITKLGAKDVIALIEGEADAEKVQAYLDAEKAQGENDRRKTVIAAAEKAMKALTAPPKKDDD